MAENTGYRPASEPSRQSLRQPTFPTCVRPRWRLGRSGRQTLTGTAVLPSGLSTPHLSEPSGRSDPNRMLAILGDLPFDLRLDGLDVVGADAARSFESKPAAVLESHDHSNVLPMRIPPAGRISTPQTAARKIGEYNLEGSSAPRMR